MSQVQVEQKRYQEMPPREGISIAHFLHRCRSSDQLAITQTSFGARILSLGDGTRPVPSACKYLDDFLNVGGGPNFG